MDEGEGLDDDGATPGTIGRRFSKRSRRNKGIVVVFDPEARKDFVTGFQRRKKKRRKFAEKQKKLKEREKRIQARKERRLALNREMGEPTSDRSELQVGDDNTELDLDQHQLDQGHMQIGTVTYENENTVTIVNTCPIDLNNDLDIQGIYKKPESSRGKDSSKNVSSKKVVSGTKRRKWRASLKQ